MIPKYRDQLIAAARRIRQRIAGVTYFGEPLDLTDPDQALVAAYEIGKHEARDLGNREAMEAYSLLDDIH